MSQWSQPGPPQRIGDAERDQAAEFLREHHAQGRLDASEFDDRITRALSAKWQSDLDQLFVDLPAPTPVTARPAPQPPIQQPPAQQRVPGLLPERTRALMNTLSMVIWPVAIIGMIALHGRGFALILIAILVTTMWRRRRHQDDVARARLARQQEAERRRLEQEGRHGNGGYGNGGNGGGGRPWDPSS